MARRRFIDPAFWTDPDIARLSPVERLFFLGCVSHADDEGRLPGSPAFLRNAIFPYDEISLDEVRAIRDRVAGACRNLILYEAGGQEYLALARWRRYQRPRYPRPSQLPPPPEDGGFQEQVSTLGQNFAPVLQRSCGGPATVLQPQDQDQDQVWDQDEEKQTPEGGSVRGETLGLAASVCDFEEKGPAQSSRSDGPALGCPAHEEERAGATRGRGAQGPTLGSGSEGGGPPAKGPRRSNTRASPQDEYPPEFEAFWEVYPRKVEKRAAFKAWRARITERVPPEDLVRAARRYAAAVAGTEPRYIKHPSTFLGPNRPYEDWLKEGDDAEGGHLNRTGPAGSSPAGPASRYPMLCVL